MLQNISGYFFLCLFSFFFCKNDLQSYLQKWTFHTKYSLWKTFVLAGVLGPAASDGSCSRGRIPSVLPHYKNIAQEDILERPTYTVFYIISVLLRIVLEVAAFWLQSRLFGFLVHSLYFCDSSSLDKTLNLTKCMVPEHFEKTIFLSAMYIFTIITMILCMAEVFEILCRRLGYLTHQRQSPAWK